MDAIKLGLENQGQGAKDDSGIAKTHLLEEKSEFSDKNYWGLDLNMDDVDALLAEQDEEDYGNSSLMKTGSVNNTESQDKADDKEEVKGE